MDLRCVECDADYYTASRFTRGLTCSECGAKLVTVPDRDQALTGVDEAPVPAAEEVPAPSH